MTLKRPSRREGELRARLTPEQYRVTQECGTEPPFRNAFWDNHAPGIYVDVVSGEPLFSSLDKFDSGTGWPSFTRPLEAGNLVRKHDSSHGMERVEVRSKHAGSHLGHLFGDGPAPTRARYCINSAALRFIPVERLAEEGYGRYLPLFSSGSAASAGPRVKTQRAVFAAGCFWGVEADFARVPGVVSTRVGYTGGRTAHPSYEQVCSGTTGHAEAVEVQFDPAKVSYRELLEAFWRTHDPARLSIHGSDPGYQYRSAIFFTSPEQEKEAIESLERFARSGRFPRGITARIEPASAFWPAEEYHQKYYEKTGAAVRH